MSRLGAEEPGSGWEEELADGRRELTPKRLSEIRVTVLGPYMPLLRWERRCGRMCVRAHVCVCMCVCGCMRVCVCEKHVCISNEAPLATIS